MPIEVTLGILLWIGLIIMAQAFQEVPKAHAPAVAFGFIPALAAWGECRRDDAQQGRARLYPASRPRPHSPARSISPACSRLAAGFILISIFFSAIMARIIDRHWRAAAIWCLIAAVLSACGIIHGFLWNGPGIEPDLTFFHSKGPGGGVPSGLDFALVYILAAVVLGALHVVQPAKVEH